MPKVHFLDMIVPENERAAGVREPAAGLRGPMHASSEIIVPLSACSEPERSRRLAQAERIFFDTASTRQFGAEAARQAFLNRWFGNYARIKPQTFLLAIGRNGVVTGYLAGCIDSFSPASTGIAAAIDYFTAGFCAALKRYPSHFHINVRPGSQGKGTGRRLVSHFARMCADAGSPGIHVVTGDKSRAVSFYEACGFGRLPPFPEAGAAHAVLVRVTDAPQTARNPQGGGPGPGR